MKPYVVDGVTRPTTRGECIDGPRPCPWVSCRHHLLLELAATLPKVDEHGNKRDARPTTIRLNRAHDPGVMGRRAGLSPVEPEALVRAWIRDAVEHLDAMEWSCSLDVADAGAIDSVQIAKLLGVTSEAIRQEASCADQLREGLAEYKDHTPIDREGNLARAGGRW